MARTGKRLAVRERRAQLVRLGMGRFSRRAYDEVSIDDIAQSAGISKGLLYHYFPTKRSFYLATLRAAAAELLSIAVPDPALPPLERLLGGLEGYLDYVAARGTAYASLLRGGIGADKEVQRVVEKTRAAFAARLLEGLPLREPGPRLRLLLRGWVGFVEAASLEWLRDRSVPRDDLRDLLVQVLLGALQSQQIELR